MKKIQIGKFKKLIIALGIIVGSFVTAYAMTRLFYLQRVETNLSKKQIFEFDLSAQTVATQLGPAESLPIEPSIFNTSTEEMYVFIEISMPEIDGSPLYELQVNDGWVLVDSTTNSYVYAYGNSRMTELNPGDQTDVLTSVITMRDISNAVYAEIDDINFTIIGYGIDTTGYTSEPNEVWEECKILRN